MRRADVCQLIRPMPGARGIFDAAAPITRTVYVEIRSVGMTETYQARSTGLAPEIKAVLPHAFDYQGETKCRLRGEMYSIIRTYQNDANEMELTLQREEGNADAG